MRFEIISNAVSTPREGEDVAYLWTDNWNDYWKFKTLYVLTYFDAEGVCHELGQIKIGQFGCKMTNAGRICQIGSEG